MGWQKRENLNRKHPWFSHEIWDCPVILPLNQSIDWLIRGDPRYAPQATGKYRTSIWNLVEAKDHGLACSKAIFKRFQKHLLSRTYTLLDRGWKTRFLYGLVTFMVELLIYQGVTYGLNISQGMRVDPLRQDHQVA